MAFDFRYSRVYNEFIEEIFSTLTEDHFPNIICFNSTFWDITRYGDKAHDEHGVIQFPQFQANVDKMCRMINEKAAKAFQNPRKNCPRLDIPCLRIWRSALPISRNARGGLLIPEITFGDSAEVYRLDMGQEMGESKLTGTVIQKLLNHDIFIQKRRI